MRSISAALLAAQKATSGVPYVRVLVQNTIRSQKHLEFVQTFSDGAADVEHDAIADGLYLHRVRVSGGNAQYERNAGSGWTTLSSAADVTHVAIAAVNATRVFVLYNRGTSIYYRESTDQGSSFAAETLLTSPGVTPAAIAAVYKNTSGDLVVVFEQSQTVRRVRRTSGTWGAVAPWSQSANQVNGLKICKPDDFLMIITGKDTSNRWTVWTLVLGDGVFVTLDTWTQFYIVNQAESDEQITFQAPYIAVFDVLRATYVEKYTGTPNYTRTFMTWRPSSAAGVPPIDWEWLDPIPLNNTTNQGYALGYNAVTGAWLSRPAQALNVAITLVQLDMSAALIEAVIEELDGLRQRATLVFDNAGGAYAGPPAPIRLGHDLDLGLGYDAAFSRPPAQSIAGWEYRRRLGDSHFVLFTEGVNHWLQRSRPRNTIVRNATKFQPVARRRLLTRRPRLLQHRQQLPRPQLRDRLDHPLPPGRPRRAPRARAVLRRHLLHGLPVRRQRRRAARRRRHRLHLRHRPRDLRAQDARGHRRRLRRGARAGAPRPGV